LSCRVTKPWVPLFCPGCLSWSDRLLRDPGGNPRGCPRCGSLERHRLLALLLPTLADIVTDSDQHHGDGDGHSGDGSDEGSDVPGAGRADSGLAVDVAPSKALDSTLDRLTGMRRLRMDFDPAADGRLVDVRASVTSIPLSDGSVDLLLCSHVLEHVPDDAQAMREIGRVLSDRGLGVILVPQRPGATDEDPDASAEERLRRFGQADHVRYYGDDFDERLTAAGLSVARFACDDLVDRRSARMLRLVPAERFWLVRPAGCARPLPTAAELRERLADGLDEILDQACSTAAEGLRVAQAEVQQAQAEVRRAQAEVRRAQKEALAGQLWEVRYRRLRANMIVRALLAVRRAGSRAGSRARRRVTHTQA
jgi:SAM-dependent methyltransferase